MDLRIRLREFGFRYSARIAENSPQGTPVAFGEPYSTLVRDDDSGKEGVFSLSLENNNGTFEISPTVGEQKAYFVIRVRNNELLDYEERPYVVFSVNIYFLQVLALSNYHYRRYQTFCVGRLWPRK